MSLEVQDKTGKAHLYFLLEDRFPVPEISIHHFERHVGGKEHALLRPPGHLSALLPSDILLGVLHAFVASRIWKEIKMETRLVGEQRGGNTRCFVELVLSGITRGRQSRAWFLDCRAF